MANKAAKKFSTADELVRVREAYNWFTEEVRKALHDDWGLGRDHTQYIEDIRALRKQFRNALDQLKHPQGPPITLLAKLGSIAVHADEMLSPDGHAFDRTALQSALNDPEVKQWIVDMGALLPQKRR